MDSIVGNLSCLSALRIMGNMIVRELRCMDDQELERLFDDLESDRVERKSAIANDKDKICEAICAFANDLPNNQKPGILFVGVHDDGTCANLLIDDRLLLSLS